MTDEELLERAAAVAIAEAPSVAEISLLRAIAATREEARRHELERRARVRVEAARGVITDVALAALGAVFGRWRAS